MVRVFIISLPPLLIHCFRYGEKIQDHFQERRVILVLGCAPRNVASPGVISLNEITHLRTQDPS